MKTTHLALSEPGGAPVTAGETSPLGRKRTRGAFILDGDRERACRNLKEEVEEEPIVTSETGAEEETSVTFQREASCDLGDVTREYEGGVEKKVLQDSVLAISRNAALERFPVFQASYT